MDDGVARGHVKIARKTFSTDSWWLERRVFSDWEAWVDVIQLAAFRSGNYRTEGGVIPLERGEFVASRRWLAKRWQWGEKRVRVWLATAQKWARLTAQRETHAGTVYLIVNYATYQNTPHEKGPATTAPKGPAGAQQGPKIEAVKAVKHLQRSPNGASQPNWVDRLVAFWSDEVGPVPHGQVGKGAKRAVERHGIDAVDRAMRCYIAQQKASGRTCKWSWFVEQIEVWIGRTSEAPAVVDGEMNHTLELLTRP